MRKRRARTLRILLIFKMNDKLFIQNVLLCYGRLPDPDESEDNWPAWNIAKQGLHRFMPVLQRYMKTSGDFLDTIEV